MDGRTQARVGELAARQHGVVTRSQLLEAGLSLRWVEYRVSTGRLVVLHRGVYLLGDFRGTLEPPRAREMAAVLACGPGAVVGLRSAARLWSLLPEADRPNGDGGGSRREVDILVPCAIRRARPGIRVRRCAELGPSEWRIVDGLPVTTAGRTLRDLSTILPAQELNRAIGRAEQRGLIGDGELASLVARHRGRAGAPLLRAAAGSEGGPLLTRSELEERFIELLRSGGLPTPEVNVTVGRHEVDFLWRTLDVAVETDGYAYHGSPRDFERDRRRDIELAAAGTHVIRLSWKQVVQEPHSTLVLLTRTLARAEERVGRPGRGRDAGRRGQGGDAEAQWW